MAQSSSSRSEASSREKVERLKHLLEKKLGPEYVSYRQGPSGGGRLTYIEGWKVINLANEILGFNGWSSSITNLTIDFADYNEQSARWNVGVTAIVKVTLTDGTYHEDIGYGHLENSKSKAAAFDKCKKEAVTDGLKRALRHFGNALGNCLYSKSYTTDVSKIKVEQQSFDAQALYKGPETFHEAFQTRANQEDPPSQKKSTKVSTDSDRAQRPRQETLNNNLKTETVASSTAHPLANGPDLPTSDYDNEVDDGVFKDLMEVGESEMTCHPVTRPVEPSRNKQLVKMILSGTAAPSKPYLRQVRNELG